MVLIENLVFRYLGDGFELDIEKLRFEDGERVAIHGPSGCGKTTMLNLIAGISRPQAGRIQVGETEVHALTESERRRFRIQKIGMIFQEFELVEYLTARENIHLPFMINRSAVAQLDKDWLEHLAETVGISDKLNRHPSRLSRGEQQRVAICRALIHQPELVLADEPTGNLDPATSHTILDLLFDHCEQRKIGLCFVTHDHSLLSRFDRDVDFLKLRKREGASAGE